MQQSFACFMCDFSETCTLTDIVNNRGDIHPIFSVADGEMGIISNKIIRYLRKLTAQTRVEKLCSKYVSAVSLFLLKFCQMMTA